MFKFLAVSLLVAVAYGNPVPELPGGFKHFWDFERDERIVGGSEASIAEAPWQAALLFSRSGSYSLACGGSIIKANVILTAAHCASGTSASTWRARCGSASSTSGGTAIDISRQIIHPSYSSSGYDYDIALQFAASSFPLNGNTMAAIALPAQGAALADGTNALITGWGATREGGGAVTTLRKATVPTVSRSLCAGSYGNIISDRMICAGNFNNGGVDACQGDSGGPLAVNRVLYGVTSFGNGCARPRYPGVWARVASFRSWIDSNS